MKHIVISTLVICLFAITGMQAQVNENVKKETTVKKVTVKDANVETIVDEEVDEKKSVIKVEGTDETNQKSEEVVVTDQVSKSVKVEEKSVNIENEEELKKLKKKEEEYKRVDGQQRGVPVSSDDEPQPQLKTKSKKDGGGK